MLDDPPRSLSFCVTALTAAIVVVLNFLVEVSKSLSTFDLCESSSTWFLVPGRWSRCIFIVLRLHRCWLFPLLLLSNKLLGFESFGKTIPFVKGSVTSLGCCCSFGTSYGLVSLVISLSATELLWSLLSSLNEFLSLNLPLTLTSPAILALAPSQPLLASPLPLSVEAGWNSAEAGFKDDVFGLSWNSWHSGFRVLDFTLSLSSSELPSSSPVSSRLFWKHKIYKKILLKSWNP